METETKKAKTVTKNAEKKIEIKEKPKAAEASNKNLICIIRITGEVKVKPEIVETLYRLRLRKKYACTLINPNNKGLAGMVNRVKHSVAYGEIDEETLAALLKARGKSINNKKINYEEAAKELMNGKTLTELGLKPFFRLHPPRKGINSKLQYPKGVLGNNGKNINELVRRML